MTAVNALQWASCEIETGWTSEKTNQKIAMDKEYMESNVMDAKIDPIVLMVLPICTSGGWNNWKTSAQTMLGKVMDENGPWVLVGIPNRDPFFVTEYLEIFSGK